MAFENIISQLDAEIARLKEVRALLSASGRVDVRVPGKRGRPKSVGVKPAKKVKRVLSPEARKRIADAQRKRWAAQRASK